MHTCKKCGNKFEGNFCNNCGEKWVEESKVCPICGGQVVDNKCAGCGIDLTPAPLEAFELTRKDDGTYELVKLKKEYYSMETLVIPESITSVKANAFSDKTVPSSPRINTVIVHAGLKCGKINLFDNLSLTNIYVDKDNKSLKTEDGALYTKNGKALIYYPCGKDPIVIAEGVTEILPGACSGLRAEEVKFPSSLEKIGRSAFQYAHLKEIILPDSVKTVEKEAFDCCRTVTKVKLSQNLESIGDNAFFACRFKELYIPVSVKKIGDSAFSLSGVEYRDRMRGECVFYCEAVQKPQDWNYRWKNGHVV